MPSAFHRPRFGVWAVEHHGTGTVTGSVLLLPPPEGDGEVEIGWHLDPWGGGFATEAARAVLAKGFDEGPAEIRAVVRPGNQRSMAVCHRLGMTPLGLTDRWYGTELEEYRITPAG